jgi:phosphatidate cytidylyltransferase
MKLKDLNVRLAISTVSVLILALLLVLIRIPYVNIVVPLVLSGLGAIAVWEYGQMVMTKGFTFRLPVVMAAVFLIIFSFYIPHYFSHLEKLPWMLFFIFFFFFFILHLKDIKEAIPQMGIYLFSLVYIGIPLGMGVAILFAPNIEGRWWIIYLIAVSKMNDIGGYFIGKNFGKSKLAEKISPKKTKEGAIGGFCCSMATSLLFYFLSSYFNISGFQLSLGGAIFLGIILSICASLGDLTESLLKRDAKVKDSNVLPAIGGILDMLDSLIFNFPVLYFYLM